MNVGQRGKTNLKQTEKLHPLQRFIHPVSSGFDLPTKQQVNATPFGSPRSRAFPPVLKHTTKVSGKGKTKSCVHGNPGLVKSFFEIFFLIDVK